MTAARCRVVWAPGVDLEPDESLLSPVERRRRDDYRDDRRRHLFAAARTLLRHELAVWWTIAPSDVRIDATCVRCGDQHGRPTPVSPPGRPSLAASITWRSGIVAVALSDCGPVGVDVERAEVADFDGFDGVVLHPREQPADLGGRLVLWTRKEALLKATGQGLYVDPVGIRLSEAGARPRLLSWDGPDAPSEPVWLHDLDLDVGAAAGSAVAASVCVISAEQPRIEVTPAGRGDARPTAIAAGAGRPAGRHAWRPGR